MRRESPTLAGILIAVGVLSVLAGCSRKASSPGSTASDAVHVVLTKTNRKYHLDALFFGQEVALDNGSHVTAIQYLSIRNIQGQDYRYSPDDASSLTSSGGFFADIWSPDEELIVLPLGRFEGFCLMRSSELTTRIAERHFDDSIRVQLASGPRLWHEFHGWKDNSTFRFGAGLSGQEIKFTYSFPRHQLVAEEKINNNFIGINSKGKIKVEVQENP